MNVIRTQRWSPLAMLALAAAVLFGPAPAWAQASAKKPNILIIWGDDIGQFNVGA